MAFWRRKKNDAFITLGLNEPSPATLERTEISGQPAQLEPPAATITSDAAAISVDLSANIEPTVMGDAPTPTPVPRGEMEICRAER